MHRFYDDDGDDAGDDDDDDDAYDKDEENNDDDDDDDENYNDENDDEDDDDYDENTTMQSFLNLVYLKRSAIDLDTDLKYKSSKSVKIFSFSNVFFPPPNLLDIHDIVSPQGFS